MRWSEQQLADHLAKTGTPGIGNCSDTSKPPFLPAFGTIQPVGGMNKTEAAYDAHLLALHGRTIVWHKFEAVKLRLADATFYSPDFAVQTISGQIEMHEVKGFWRDDARVKIKVAAALYPFRFIAVTRDNAGWKTEEFGRAG